MPTKLWLWLCETAATEKLKLWHLLVGGVLTSIISIGGSYWVTQHASYQAILADRSKDLVQASADFENRVRDLLISGDTFERLSRDQYAQLNGNIEIQIAALNKLTPVLSSDKQKQLAIDYQETLVDIRDVLDDGLKPENTRKFGMDAILLTKRRARLLESLS